MCVGINIFISINFYNVIYISNPFQDFLSQSNLLKYWSFGIFRIPLSPEFEGNKNPQICAFGPIEFFLSHLF